MSSHQLHLVLLRYQLYVVAAFLLFLFVLSKGHAYVYDVECNIEYLAIEWQKEIEKKEAEKEKENREKLEMQIEHAHWCQEQREKERERESSTYKPD
jgi:F0F1-type ATP synthase epsilon subunit